MGHEITETKSSTELSTNLSVITAEINAYKKMAGEAIFEIGRRLKHVKENDLAHGQWSKWCEEEIGMNRKTADKFIVVYEQLGGNDSTSSQIGISILYEIATLPPEERDKPHTIPSTGETKTVYEMTVRELREVKKALKVERERAKQAEAEANKLRSKLKEAENAPPKVEYIEVPDKETEEELAMYKERYGEVGDSEPQAFRIDNSTEINGLALAFSSDVRELLRKYSHLRHYSRELLTANEQAIAEYYSSVEALRGFVNEVGRVVTRKEGKTIIEMEAV